MTDNDDDDDDRQTISKKRLSWNRRRCRCHRHSRVVNHEIHKRTMDPPPLANWLTAAGDTLIGDGNMILLMSLPGHTQRLLVLLFGTFRVIASNSERAGTGMTSEALGVSVAPSFFQSCVSDGKTARMEDVLRFKVATRIMKQMIEQFAACDLFGRDNYEYYARVTGRVLRVQDEWIFSFRYPPPPRGKTAQQNYAFAQEESHSTPALLTTGGPNVGNSAVSLGIIPEHSLLESCARLSVSLEGPGIFNVQKSSCSSSSHSSSSTTTRSGSQHHMTLDELRAVNRYAESTKSLSFLPQVHERQAARMRTRSEWFLGARGGSLELCHPQIVTSTPIPGSILGSGGGGPGPGPGHHHHGIIGTYCNSIDEHLNDIVVVDVDVNHHEYLGTASTTNHHHHHHHPHHSNNRHHYHHHHRYHHPYHFENGTASASGANNRRSQAAGGDGWFFEHCDSIEIDPEDVDVDMLDGEEDDSRLRDEHDFAVIQSHHFDNRAENRRRRRRQLIRQRRHSYDQLLSMTASASTADCGRSDRPSSSKDQHSTTIVPAATAKKNHSKHDQSSAPPSARAADTAATNTIPSTAIATTSSATTNGTPSRSSNNLNNTITTTTGAGSLRSPSRNNSSSSANSTRQSNLSILVFTVLDFLF
ncbi:hypothetical protein RP20_CCG005255 [Aedes albopictus]|nr:hypothetical protein RP20_CCG005255 [Aedes albopictus]